MNREQARIAAAETQGWTGPWRFGNEHLHGTPPSGVKKNHDGDHVPEAVDRLVVELHDRIAVLSAGIAAVSGLIDESQGVAGLHLNGDVATWEELRQGGRFEEWLSDFDEALRIEKS
jgi:hypothetical protein